MFLKYSSSDTTETKHVGDYLRFSHFICHLDRLKHMDTELQNSK